MIRLGRYADPQRGPWWAVVGADESVSPLTGSYATTGDLIRDGEADWRAAAQAPGQLQATAVEWLAPITTPCRVMCLGANYRQHAIESGMDPDDREFNLFFDKTDASVTGPADPVVRPAHVRLLDFEIELALVLRREITEPVVVTPENLGEFVFGITIANDLSARDVQLPQGQFLKGKSYRGFCPTGPYIVVPEADELGVLDRLDLRLEVNGELRQSDTTANLLFGPAESLTELSTFCNSSPGDLLLTGTPHGCVATSPPAIVRRLATAILPERKLWAAFVKRQLDKPYLQPGDRVTASIRTADGSVDLGRQDTLITAPTQEVTP
ncbi:MAG: fumarylacetoacetate hydrolase family protein [Aeromicrobium sp.]|uniref:fumarylacetoacetate hydrolase family protein n=1 Tax=Aeromicrobium sp. TaxID=1871063 RepID=UPI0026335577|nr:fumarylacetoacetate hydrolase family protein [Aeromicrobium sp.]MDF1706198.1 fumarylacetoacetate hydrolase family protein [Aeromicrobium sp.]